MKTARATSSRHKKESLAAEVTSLLVKNIRDYAMYIALAVIFLIFTIATNGLFISSRNLINLVNQTGYVAVLAIGMTLILIIKHIDPVSYTHLDVYKRQALYFLQSSGDQQGTGHKKKQYARS